MPKGQKAPMPPEIQQLADRQKKIRKALAACSGMSPEDTSFIIVELNKKLAPAAPVSENPFVENGK
jgi:hypothetical protein